MTAARFWAELDRMVRAGLYIESARPGFRNEHGILFRLPFNT